LSIEMNGFFIYLLRQKTNDSFSSTERGFSKKKKEMIQGDWLFPF
jgi:hypothetical protein